MCSVPFHITHLDGIFFVGSSLIYLRRALVVQREQNQVRKNLRKYNNFVKEKQIKVEDGNRVYHEEKDFQQSITHLLEEKREQAEALAETKVYKAIFRILSSRTVAVLSVSGADRERREQEGDLQGLSSKSGGDGGLLEEQVIQYIFWKIHAPQG